MVDSAAVDDALAWPPGGGILGLFLQGRENEFLVLEYCV